MSFADLVAELFEREIVLIAAVVVVTGAVGTFALLSLIFG